MKIFSYKELTDHIINALSGKLVWQHSPEGTNYTLQGYKIKSNIFIFSITPEGEIGVYFPNKCFPTALKTLNQIFLFIEHNAKK